VIHIAAAARSAWTTLAGPTTGANSPPGRRPLEAMRCLKRRIFRRHLATACRRRPSHRTHRRERGSGRARRASQISSAAGSTHTPTLRISHSRARTDDATRGVDRREETHPEAPANRSLDTEGSRSDPGRGMRDSRQERWSIAGVRDRSIRGVAGGVVRCRGCNDVGRGE
jgi:hypothetical protein